MTRPTPAEAKVTDEILSLVSGFMGVNPRVIRGQLSPRQLNLYIAVARWHLAKLGEALADERMGTLLSMAGKSSIRFQTALKTLRQIAALPRGGRAKRLAVAALRFLENVK